MRLLWILVVLLCLTPCLKANDSSVDAQALSGNESECMKSTAPEYANWVTLGKPACWCYRKQCRGDIDGMTYGPFAIGILDLDLFKLAFNKAVLPAGGECADFDHLKFGPFRVAILDLDIFKIYFNQAVVPQCSMTNINFWTN